jgi:hypothetical protein
MSERMHVCGRHSDALAIDAAAGGGGRNIL